MVREVIEVGKGNTLPTYTGSVSHQQAIPIPAILGPLQGLGYILLLPFVGAITIILQGFYRASQSLSSMRHKAAQSQGEVSQAGKTEDVNLGELLQPLIDGLECEFVVVNPELRIMQYVTPPSRQSKLLEQAAVGRYCFEISHGRDCPCESKELECPVKKVLETNDKVTVTHYHASRLVGKGEPRLVRVLALPVRDSHSHVKQVAELIWDVEDSRKIVMGAEK